MGLLRWTKWSGEDKGRKEEDVVACVPSDKSVPRLEEP